nr:hypothetical protein [Tanacetum cinerariifolium]
MCEGSVQPTDTQHTPTFEMPPPKPKKSQKPRQPKRKTTKVPPPNESTDIDADKADHKEGKVLDLEDELKKTKTAQQSKIDGLERRVKKLEKKHISRTHKLKRLCKVSLTAMVISFSDDEALDKEDTSTQGRIDEIDVDEDIALVSTHDDVVQDEGIEDVSEEEVVDVVTTTKMLIDTVVDVSQVTTVIADVSASKRKRVMIQEPEETTTTKIASSQQPQVQDKGKGKAKLIEEPVKLKKKDQIFFDEEVARKLQEEIYEQKRLVRERARQEEEANSALTETWEDIQKRRKFFAAKRTAEKRNKPPTKAQQRIIMSTYLKNMDGWKPRALKNKSFTKIKELSDKAMTRINNYIDFKTKLVEVEDDKESEELKKCLEIIPNDGEEVTIEATPLSSKSPTIVDYKIYKEGKKNYF